LWGRIRYSPASRESGPVDEGACTPRATGPGCDQPAIGLETVVIPAPMAYVKVVAVKTLVVAVGSFRSLRWPTGSVPLARRAGRLARGDVGPTKVPIGVQLSG
jgi:hypothetical protein